jgi:glycosyltransferase involved in cell wall biosynthesis
MRVLHVISEMGNGGAETLVAGMALAGGAVGWTSAVASGGGHRADALRARGVPTFTVPVARRKASGVVRAAAAVRSAIQAFGPDVVLAHNVSATVVTRLAIAPGRALPVVTVCHGLADEDYRSAARILRHTARTVVAVADATADRLRDAGLPGPVVIPNAVFPQQATVPRAVVRATLGLTPDVPVALCVARMEPQKRHDVLLEAWAKLGGDAVLLLAGDGSRRTDLTRQCAELGLTDRVRFLGTRADVPALLAATDVTVLTSDWEGMPIAVLESMAADRPVVATDVSGVRAVLAGGGIVVPRRDPAATAEALGTLLFDPAARTAAAAAGLAAIRRRHDPHTFMRSYDRLLRAAIRGRRR